MVEQMPEEIRSGVPLDLVLRDWPSMLAGSQAIHFFQAQLGNLCGCFLLGMNSKGGKKLRHPNETRARFPKAQQEVPIDREVEALVYRPTSPHPRSTPPEERLLRDVIRPDQHIILMGRHHPAADLGVVRIDEQAVSIDNINIGMFDEIADDEL